MPPGAETRVVLDRRRLRRDDRGQEDEDQQHRQGHRQGRPERGQGDRSERAIVVDGRLHATKTPERPDVLHGFPK